MGLVWCECEQKLGCLVQWPVGGDEWEVQLLD